MITDQNQFEGIPEFEEVSNEAILQWIANSNVKDEWKGPATPRIEEVDEWQQCIDKETQQYDTAVKSQLIATAAAEEVVRLLAKSDSYYNLATTKLLFDVVQKIIDNHSEKELYSRKFRNLNSGPKFICFASTLEQRGKQVNEWIGRTTEQQRKEEVANFSNWFVFDRRHRPVAVWSRELAEICHQEKVKTVKLDEEEDDYEEPELALPVLQQDTGFGRDFEDISRALNQ